MFTWLKKFGEVFKRSFAFPPVASWSPQAINYLGSPRSSAGVSVNRMSVLAYPAVWRCISLIGHKVGRLPLDVYRRNKDGGREVDSEHDAQWLLAKHPSDLYTPYTLKATLVQHALLHGNGYCWIIREQETAKPIELLILNPEVTGIGFDNNKLFYHTRMGANGEGGLIKILPENMLHIKNVTHDGLLGYDVISMLQEAFGLGLAAQRYGSVYFRNNGSPGPTILKIPGKLDKDRAEWYRNEWNKVHLGIDNAHRVAIMADGGEVQNFTIDNERGQFLQLREFEVAAGIANIFGVPAHKLGVKISTAYNSLESEEKAFLNDCLDQWLVNIEEEFEKKLLRYSQKVRDSHFIAFDRRSLEQADYKTRSETLIAEVNNGLRTQNEGRAELTLPGIGPDGDLFRMPSNIVLQDGVIAKLDEPESVDVQPAENPVGGVTGTDPEKAPVGFEVV